MATERDQRGLEDRRAALLATLADQFGSDAMGDVGDEIVRQVDALVDAARTADTASAAPPDLGLAELVGVGAGTAPELGATRVPQGIQPYDETVASERIIAVADLYYIYQHERIGVFRAIQKLQELFRAGAVFLSEGQGAFRLYQFDRREVLRYTQRDRLAAYRRAFGYGSTPVVRGAHPNIDFHPLFSGFNQQVALFWRDKRISDVLRERAFDPAFGSIAVVRRAGLDLRNNLKFMSYGHVNVLRVEVMQLLEEAFRIFAADDIKKQFGADTAWDVVESILVRHFNERLVTSPRQRMAVAGREVLRWLAQPHVLQAQRSQFETALRQIAEFSEEWLTSAQSLGLAPAPGQDARLPWTARSAARPPQVLAPRRPTGPAARMRAASMNGAGH